MIAPKLASAETLSKQCNVLVGGFPLSRHFRKRRWHGRSPKCPETLRSRSLPVFPILPFGEAGCNLAFPNVSHLLFATVEQILAFARLHGVVAHAQPRVGDLFDHIFNVFFCGGQSAGGWNDHDGQQWRRFKGHCHVPRDQGFVARVNRGSVQASVRVLRQPRCAYG